MNLYLVTFSLLLSTVHFSDGKPQFYALKETESEAKEALTRGFAAPKQNLDLPPPPKVVGVTDFTNPYNFNLTNDGSGNYYFGYNVGGSGRYETGELKNAGTDNEIQTVKGQYIDRFVTKEGTTIVRTIGYIADENGYQPFLIDISVLPLQQSYPSAAYGSGYAAPVGAPKSGTGIGSATLATLNGGGLGK